MFAYRLATFAIENKLCPFNYSVCTLNLCVTFEKTVGPVDAVCCRLIINRMALKFA